MAGKVNVPIAVAIQGLANVQRQFNQLGKGIGAVGKSAGVAAIGFGAFVAGVKGADFAMQAIAGARDLERNLAGLKTVFEGTTPQMVEFSKSAVDVGLSMSEAAKSSTFIGSVLKQSGFEIQETADLTERLTKLATDLSITYGYDVQEALLGMTALFRGEYDPIEKFGVAMKQSEINSELAAQGLSNLEGAERRLAEQQVRVNLLFQRSADAQGAMERQSGTLAVEQLKLAASFGNVRDTVAESLLPILGELTAMVRENLVEIEPVLKETFEELAPVLQEAGAVLIPAMGEALVFFIELVKETIQLVGDMFNPTTALGESLAALGIQVQSIFMSITGNKLELETVFDMIGAVLTFLTDAAHDVLYVIDNTIIGLKVLGEMAAAFFTGDWVKLFSTDWGGMIEGQIASKNAFNDQMLAVKQLNFEMAQTEQQALANRNAINAQAAALSLSNLPKYIRDSLSGANAVNLTGGGSTGSSTSGGAKQAKDFVGDFFKGIKEEVQKQKARIRLEGLGLSESLIDQILGSQGWEAVFKKVIASGTAGLRKLQEEFNRTAAGIKALEAERKATLDEATAYIEKMQAEADRLYQIFLDAQAAAESFKKEMQEISKVNILPTIEEDLGRFEAAVISSFEAIQGKLDDGLIDGTILQKDFEELTAYARVEREALAAISRQRDDLANRKSLSEALIKEYRTALTSALSLTNLLDQIEQQSSEVTVTEIEAGTAKVGTSIKELSFTLTREYTQVIESVVNKSESLVDNFRNMAERARGFGENLRKLRDLGLDPQLFAQLVQAGVEAGGETAQALVDGGSETINEINSLFQEIDAIGASLGEEAAATLYGAGINMGDGLLAGIASRQSELEELAKAMADAFNQNFNASVSMAVAKPVEQAREAAAAAQAAVPDINDINLDALAEVNRLLAGAAKSLEVVKGDAFRSGIQLKAGVLETLKQDILSGAVVDISGIQSGLSSAELINRASNISPSVNNTYNVTVNSSSRVDGAKAGEAFVAAINTFEDNSGNSSIYLR